MAELLAAVACERDGAVLDAESHLREAVRADPGWPPAEDRLAWYVVPDGESHQLIGGLFRVPPGTEGPLLELLDRRDGFGLLSFVAAQSRPRTLVTTDEPLLDAAARRRTRPPPAPSSTAATSPTGPAGFPTSTPRHPTSARAGLAAARRRHPRVRTLSAAGSTPCSPSCAPPCPTLG